MGEYARYQDEDIKIGTCENMYYLRIEDVHKVEPIAGNVDPRTDNDLRFRLPFPDEDANGPGTGDYNRGVRLFRIEGEGMFRQTIDYRPEWLQEADPGSLQLSHPSGLLLSVPCHHGDRLPDLGEGARAHWNGKSHSLELYMVKRTREGVFPIVRCRHCGDMWRVDWAEVLPYVHDEVLRERLEKHGGHANG